MEYKGKLYGKVGEQVFPLLNTTDDWEKMENRIKELEAENEALKRTDLNVARINDMYKNVRLALTDSEEKYEPYFGWCDVEGCENEGANGGGCWRETGYWTFCSKHSAEHRAGKPQPPMKQTAIDREKSRGADGVLVNEG
jgi:hypothetical protein